VREATEMHRATSATVRPPLAKDGWSNSEWISHPTVAFLSTYLPSRCGIASFTHSLANALAQVRGSGGGLGVIRLMGEDAPADNSHRVVARVVPGSPGWAGAAAAAAARFDLLSIQHEYGIYGPDDGIALLDLLGRAAGPVITTLHTIPAWPSPRQRLILNELAARSARVMVMAEVARRRLLERYRVDPERVVVIPHGAPGVPPHQGPSGEHGRPVVLTWGLIGPGKGIETAISALRHLRHLDPPPLYLICGQTHPNVRRAQGESYRRGLERLAVRAQVAHMVRFVDQYMDEETLGGHLGRAAVVLLPYDSVDQVTSGVLVEALGAGRPVVATSFPHAVEALAGGAGRVVPRQDPEAMAAALAAMLRGPEGAEAARAARAAGASLLWPAVASRFEAEVQRLAAPRPARSR